MNIIGLSGKKLAGKTEVANIIKRSVPGVAIINFADALKDEVCAKMCITRVSLENNKALYRGLLQWWGTEYRRSQNESYWTEEWMRRCLASTASTIVVADVRFPNEYDVIRGCGGLLYRVERPQSGVPDTHPSETSLDSYQFDRTIQNNSTLFALECVIRDIIKTK